MRRLFCMLLVALVLTGCAGATRAKYSILKPEQLPAELADWKDRVASEVSVTDAVVGSDTYLRIAVGPCPSADMKISAVSLLGESIWVEMSTASKGEAKYYPVVFLRVSWDMRAKYAPRGMNIQVNGDLPQYFDADQRSDIRPGVRPGEPDTFRPRATYVPREDFVCAAR